MAARSFIGGILRTERFDGTNYASWKRKLGYVRYEKGWHNVFTEAPLSQPRGNTSQAMRDAYAEWEHQNILARHILPVAMHDSYASKYGPIKTAKGMHDQLKKEYADPSLMRKTLAMKKYNDLKMGKGGKIVEHVHTFKALVRELEAIEMWTWNPCKWFTC
ncbi:uncharacterized protein LOC110006838 [Amborella trichopoda]|uniref:uncharacterized protein LOC110006838 n=1 Tax=Amborella trichopoda TaxID=13333 RepID=UPI0009BD4C05|nr:uncharacterized protein LOC110006838 [Amborella trichopoda]|eukprot:XP_020520094.1 uncharacterized protein LOC110006838 [Amborella trichopoda]